MNLQTLNNEFGRDQQCQFVEEKAGFIFIKLQSKLAVATISLYGGQVLSFTAEHADSDLLFLSNKAWFETGKSIKGGCPICWPCFAQHADNALMPFHGFVRNQNWDVKAVEVNEQDEVEISLSISDNENSRAIWPYKFELIQKITIGKQLRIELITCNTGDQAFEITQAIHTYFSVGDIHQVSINGFDEKYYLDKVTGFAEKKQQGAIRFNSEVDRIYLDVSNALVIDDESLSRKIIIESEHSQTAIVWNPWEKISHESVDLDNESYLQFVCVETANAGKELLTVLPGESHSLVACYSIENVC